MDGTYLSLHLDFHPLTAAAAVKVTSQTFRPVHSSANYAYIYLSFGGGAITYYGYSSMPTRRGRGLWLVMLGFLQRGSRSHESQYLLLSQQRCPDPALGYPLRYVRLAYQSTFLHVSSTFTTGPVVNLTHTSENCASNTRSHCRERILEVSFRGGGRLYTFIPSWKLTKHGHGLVGHTWLVVRSDA